ncbi:MAG: hypothetical protein IKC26_02810 [Clostridia bacterium]|nr:hypothetical protein [Clostridia bacterium]
MKRNLHMDLLLCYVREDGLFARYISERRETTVDVSVRKEISEASLREDLSELCERVRGKVDLTDRRVTVAFALSRRVEVLKPCVSEQLSVLPFADSVSVLPRDELFYRAATTLSQDAPCEVLYCDTRETRLFTVDGEVPLSSGRSGGNGFYDWLFGFVEDEGESFEYYEGQIDRLEELFRVYRCFKPHRNEEASAKRTVFPERARHPLLYNRPALSGKETSRGRLDKGASEGADASAEARIDYTALTASDKARVDRRLPAFYKLSRDKYGKHGRISMGEAAERFARLLDGIRDARLTRLVVVGAYADFPLTGDFLRSLPQEMTISYGSESKLLLDGMEDAVIDRIVSSRLLLSDMDGEELVLWDSFSEASGACPEKRVSFSATLRRTVSAEEWKKKAVRMPYAVEFEELRRDEKGSYKRVRVTKSGDFRTFCYKRQRDGSYRLRVQERESDSSIFRSAVLGVAATPVGVICRLLSE